MQIHYTKKELTIIAAILEMKLLDETAYLKWDPLPYNTVGLKIVLYNFIVTHSCLIGI